MKHTKKFLVVLATLSLGIVGLASCNNNPQPEPTPTPEPEPGWKIAQRAMTNFGENLAKGDYSIHADDIIDVSVIGNDAVITRYPGHSAGHNFAVMSVNGEAFQAGIPEDDPMRNLVFVDQESALEAYKAYLPNAFFDKSLTHKTISELFVNPKPTDNPFHFIARKDSSTVYQIVANIVSFGTVQLESLVKNDIYLDFDSVDVNTATITGTYTEQGNPPVVKQLTITITFGTYQSDSRVNEWMGNPDRAYPDPVGQAGNWKNTRFYLDLQSATNLHDGVDGFIPFIDHASYAVVDNAATFAYSDKNVDKIRDYHGTEEDVEDYKYKLIRNQYTPVVEKDGTTHYRRILRAYSVNKKRCYADIQVSYDRGFYLVVGMFYEGDTYTSLAEFNTAIVDKGFVALPDTEVFTNYDGLDYTFHAYESNLCLMDYTLYILMYAKYTTLDAAQAYLDSYTNGLLELGYRFVAADNEWIYKTNLHQWVFGYAFQNDGTVKIKVNVQDYIAGSVVKAGVEAAGFPELDVTFVSDARDIRDYVKFMFNQDASLAYEARYTFDTPANANSFAHNYVQALKNLGFTVNGEESGFTIYVKGNMQVRTAIGGATSTFVGFNFYVFDN